MTTDQSKSNSPINSLGKVNQNLTKNELIKNYKVNLKFLIFYVFIMAANGIGVAWTTGGNNQTANLFSAKLNWTDDETRIYNSMINFAS